MTFPSRQARPAGPGHVRRLSRAACIAFVMLFLPFAQAQVPPLIDLDSYPEPEDFGRLHFYLVTVDVGDRIWDNFGHTALRMHDEVSGADVLFNWGGFDVSGGMLSFGFRFFLGEMNYRLFTVPTGQAYALYREEERSVWEDRINLNNVEKARLYQRLMWNLEPENLVYEYDYFDDNCTTRLRDYLDEALDGRLSNQYTGTTETTYRQVVQSHYASLSIVAMLLDLAMNSNIDRAMSEWESMFLPLNLRRLLSRMDSDVARGGEQLPLLAKSRLVEEFPPPSRQWNAYMVFVFFLFSFALWLLFATKRRRYSRFMDSSQNVPRTMSPAGYQALGAATLMGSIFSGMLGSLMLGSWFWSGHEDLHHNFNLLLFWPTDFLGIPVALRWLFLKSPWPLDQYSAPYVNYYFLAHMLGIGAYAGIHFGGLTEQDLSNVAMWLLAPMAVVIVLVWQRGYRRTENAIML